VVDGLSRALWPLGASRCSGAALAGPGTRCECVDAAAGDRARALASNPALRSSAVAVEKQALERRIARGERLPKVDLTAGYTRYHYPTLVTPIRRAGEFPRSTGISRIWVPPSTCRCMPAASSLPENRWPLTLPRTKRAASRCGPSARISSSTLPRPTPRRCICVICSVPPRLASGRSKRKKRHTTLRMGEGRHRD